MSDPVMPDFVFARRRDIELEAGFVLAGNLVTKFPKGSKLRGRDKKAIREVTHKLGSEAEAGRMSEDAICYIWMGDGKPPNAVQTPIADDVMERWAAEHIVIAIRVDPRRSGTLKIDSDLARQLGLGPTTH